MITFDLKKIIAKPDLRESPIGLMATVTLIPCDPEYGPEDKLSVLEFHSVERIDQLIDSLRCARSMLVLAKGDAERREAELEQLERADKRNYIRCHICLHENFVSQLPDRILERQWPIKVRCEDCGHITESRTVGNE